MRLREFRDSPTCCELFWGPGGSVRVLFEFFRVFGLTMVVVKGREVLWLKEAFPNLPQTTIISMHQASLGSANTS